MFRSSTNKIASHIGAVSILAIFVGCGPRQPASPQTIDESSSIASATPHDTGITSAASPESHESSIKFDSEFDSEFDHKIDYAETRRKMDAKVWAQERNAQQYERYFVTLWDQIRSAKDKNSVLEGLSFREIAFAPAVGAETLEHDILRFRFGADLERLDLSDWKSLTEKLRISGYRLLETEWHHSAFEHTANVPRSTVNFVMHLTRPLRLPLSDSSPQQRVLVRGVMDVEWKVGLPPQSSEATSPEATSAEMPSPETVAVRDLEILVRTGVTPFQKMLTCERTPDQFASAHPIIVYDLNCDGFPEIIIPRWNRVYWSELGTRFREARLLKHFEPIAEAGVVADVTSDGIVDFVSINRAGKPIVFQGTVGGHFPEPARVLADIHVPDALAITAGDIDSDGDVDLWITQYKPSYVEGQMPTPYYDANDGSPAFLLNNSGDGTFLDATVVSGLAAKRNRRTYSSSFVDIDDDWDLDLVVVSDYAGVDLYSNDGNGQFEDVTDEQLPNKSLFGMAHSIADFNSDGNTDLYAIGMSSTTARRLDQMGLVRNDRPDIHEMRPEMGYGNRMFLRDGNRFVVSPHSSDVARTGWSWGTTSFDFDLDGDRDIYVANGFRSGDSCQDYCTNYWTHDIYTGDSNSNPNLASFFADSMKGLNANAISWNGYEHNALLMNRGESGFTNVAHLFGVAFEFDSRAVVGADLDRDGRPDLLVADYEYVGRGFELSLHVFRNTLETSNHWIGVDLTNTDPRRARNPIGAKVTVTTDRGKQVAHYVTGDSFLSQHPATLHFGLGSRDVHSVQIRWPNGEKEIATGIQLNRYLRADQGFVADTP